VLADYPPGEKNDSLSATTCQIPNAKITRFAFFLPASAADEQLVAFNNYLRTDNPGHFAVIHLTQSRTNRRNGFGNFVGSCSELH